MGRDALIDKAWKLYCEETAGSMDVRDFWEELNPKIQKIYLDKAEQSCYNEISS